MPARASRAFVGPGLLAGALLAVCVGTGARQAPAVQSPIVATGAAVAHHVDRAKLMADVVLLASDQLQGRLTSSPGGIKARDWIIGEFVAIGLQPAGTSAFLEPFSFSDRSVRALAPGGQPFQTDYKDAANVLGILRGTDAGTKCIVVSAHYDHLGVRDRAIYHGADDNASGVATLLAAARWFKAHPPRHPMLIAAFDAEEEGLQGSKAFVGSALLPPKQTAIDVNLDMVSRNDHNEIYAAGTFQSPWLTPILADIQHRAAVKIMLGHDRPKGEAGGLDDWTQQSDHGAFAAAGIPFLYFGVEDHADYHKPTDTPDKISPEFFGDAADMIVEAIVTLDQKMP